MTTPKIGGKFAKHFQPGQVLVPHLNNWFANAKFPEEIPILIHPNKEEDDAFHPSSALRCALELYASLRNDLPHEKPAADAQKTFMIGHMYHSLLQYAVVEGLGFATWDDIEKEYDFYFETEAGNPYRVRGFIDIARCVIPNRSTYLVDIKTMHARIYAQNSLPESTLEKYTAQVKLYLEFEELPEALILCAEKDNPHRFKEITIQRDPEFVADVIEKWETVADALVLGEPPKCTCLNPSRCLARDLYIDTLITK